MDEYKCRSCNTSWVHEKSDKAKAWGPNEHASPYQRGSSTKSASSREHLNAAAFGFWLLAALGAFAGWTLIGFGGAIAGGVAGLVVSGFIPPLRRAMIVTAQQVAGIAIVCVVAYVIYRSFF